MSECAGHLAGLRDGHPQQLPAEMLERSVLWRVFIAREDVGPTLAADRSTYRCLQIANRRPPRDSCLLRRSKRLTGGGVGMSTPEGPERTSKGVAAMVDTR